MQTTNKLNYLLNFKLHHVFYKLFSETSLIEAAVAYFDILSTKVQLKPNLYLLQLWS